MTQKFYKGRTNNHLTWVMVDATDFATPESAMSAATKIKIYGKLRSGTGVNFVSSGTGSLTNDIVHVGASVLGIYTIALAKADLSDASAAWYDQYVIALSATGAAYQTLIVDGGIDDSYLSNVVSYLSNVNSYMSNFASNVSNVISDIRSGTSDTNSKLVVMSGILSDSYSMLAALSDAVSNVHSELTSQFAVVSNYLSNISAMVSDVDSAVTSQYSNLLSTLGSQFAVVSDYLSNASNFQSDILSTLGSQFAVQSNYLSYISNTVSGLGAGASASAVAAKVWSDYESKVGASPSQVYSQLQSMLSDTKSAAVLGTSYASDAASGVTVLQSRITSVTATASDLVSKIWAHAYPLDLSAQISDMRSTMDSQFLVVSNYLSNLSNFESDILSTMGSQFAVVSNYLSNISAMVSDTDSALSSQFVYMSNAVSDMHSDIASKISAITVTVSASDISEIASQVAVGIGFTPTSIASKVWSDYESRVGATVSNQYSYLSDQVSNLTSRITKAVATNSQLSDLHSDLKSYLAVMSGMLSDVDSAADSQFAYMSNAVSDMHSDLASKIGAITVTVSASDISEIASQVAVGIGFTPTSIASKVWSDYESRVGTTVSNQYSYLSDQVSNLTSRVPKAVATNSQLSDLHSDLKSYLAALSDAISNVDSAADSQYAALSGMVSDVDSALSSQFAYMSNAVSDMHSDLGSKIGGVSVTLGPSDISDLASALVDAGVGGNITHVRGQSLIGTGVAGDPWRPA